MQVIGREVFLLIPWTNHDYRKPEIIDIAEIISSKKLTVHFQPVISVSRKRVSGLEGLIRGIDSATNQIIAPADLFEAAKQQGLTLELDRICRDKVIEAFSSIYRQSNDKLLFLNVDASILDRAEGSKYLMNQINSYQIKPGNIVIEINETRVQDIEALKRFTDTYRRLGFMVALDDVGTGFSNMDRILLVKPNIIKIDISLVRNIHSDYFKQGIFKSLVNLANSIGALVIAEGVETAEEAVEILRLGGHMIQGYLFAKPQEMYQDSNSIFSDKIEALIKSFNAYLSNKIKEERQNNKQLLSIVNYSLKRLVTAPVQEFDNSLMEIIWESKSIECAYILDESGVQISSTIRFCDKNEVKDNLLFYSADMGTDHSMEKYYYPLMSAKVKKHITEPYISLATGNLCITISKLFQNVDNKKYILCMDFSSSNDNIDLGLVNDITRPNFIKINGQSLTELNKIISKMNEEISKDSLTNAYNRRFMGPKLLVDISRAVRGNQPISVILADIDLFKNINDTFGHLAGDRVLKEFVKIANSKIRTNTDWIARYGGEEFLIVLINADRHAAFKVAEKIRKAVEGAKIRYNQVNINITASFGTYTLSSVEMTWEQLIDHADKNLYIAKNSGRNKTIN